MRAILILTAIAITLVTLTFTEGNPVAGLDRKIEHPVKKRSPCVYGPNMPEQDQRQRIPQNWGDPDEDYEWELRQQGH